MIKSKLKAKLESLIESHSKITVYSLEKIDKKFMLSCCAKRDSEGIALSEAVYINMYGRPKCAIKGCKGLPKYRRSIQQGYSKYCSSLCAGKDKDVKDKRIQTNQEKYGTNSPTQVPSIQAKQSATMIERYGVPFSAMSKELDKKRGDTCMKRFGVYYAMQSKEIQKKICDTTEARYGVRHIMQDRDRFEKQQAAGFKIKEELIGTKIFRVRGFELAAIKWLITQNINPEDIFTTKAEGVPTIWYKEKGKERAYHPDLLVLRNGKKYLIEVKSTYTCGIMSNKKAHRSGKFSNVKRKMQACKDAGWNIKLLVVSKMSSKRECTPALIHNVHKKSRSQVKAEAVQKGDFVSSDL